MKLEAVSPVLSVVVLPGHCEPEPGLRVRLGREVGVGDLLPAVAEVPPEVRARRAVQRGAGQLEGLTLAQRLVLREAADDRGAGGLWKWAKV